MNLFEKTRTSILSFSNKERLAFGLLVLRELLPNYEYFSREEGFGDIKVLQKIFDIGKQSLLDSFLITDIATLKVELMDISPDSEDYPSVYSTYALDVCAACYDIIALLKNDDKKAVSRISELAENTIYISILEKINSDFSNEELYLMPEMLEEFERQNKYSDLCKKYQGREFSNLIDSRVKESTIGLS